MSYSPHHGESVQRQTRRVRPIGELWRIGYLLLVPGRKFSALSFKRSREGGAKRGKMRSFSVIGEKTGAGKLQFRFPSGGGRNGCFASITGACFNPKNRLSNGRSALLVPSCRVQRSALITGPAHPPVSPQSRSAVHGCSGTVRGYSFQYLYPDQVLS